MAMIESFAEAGQYFLHIERLTQNRFSGDPETPVATNSIDSEKNLHIYLSGNIPPERSVQLRTLRIAMISPTSDSNLARGSAMPATTQYKASLPHYTLTNTSKYVLRAVDDDQIPFATASIEIQTI